MKDVISFNVSRIVVQLDVGVDTVLIYTKDYPPPERICSECTDDVYEYLCLTFKVAKNYGVKYVTDNFGIDPEILDMKYGGWLHSLIK